MSLIVANITERATGCTVSLPLDDEDLVLARDEPYWRAFFFRLGLGINIEEVSEAALKAARPGDYEVQWNRR